MDVEVEVTVGGGVEDGVHDADDEEDVCIINGVDNAGNELEELDFKGGEERGRTEEEGEADAAAATEEKDGDGDGGEARPWP